MSWTIYILKDPRTNAVRYVGKTTASLQRRLSGHISEAVTLHRNYRERAIFSLVRIGLFPIIEAVERGSGDWQAAERRWIAFYRSQGARLWNTTDGGENPPQAKRSEERSAANRKVWSRLTAEERQRRTANARSAMTSEKRRANMLSYNASLTPEQRRAQASAQLIEHHSRVTPEAYRAIAAKGWATRRRLAAPGLRNPRSR